MELDAVDRQLAVADGHDLAVGRGRRDLEARPGSMWRRASGSGRRGSPAAGRRRARARRAATSVALPCTSSCAAPISPPKTSTIAWWPRHTPSSGHAARERAHDLLGDAGGLGPARAGRDDEVRRRDRLRLLDRDLVVPPHDHLRSQLAEQVREVVRERVVVVDQEDVHARRLREVDRGLERGELAQALLVLGARVAVGDDAGARLEQRDAVVEDDRPDRDARVERPPGSAYSTAPAYGPRR